MRKGGGNEENRPGMFWAEVETTKPTTARRARKLRIFWELRGKTVRGKTLEGVGED